VSRHGGIDLPDTGERTHPPKPGERPSLWWTRHLARYEFAARQASLGARVLDDGCGTGYGTALLAERLRGTTVGVDVSEDAIGFARGSFASPDVRFEVADAARLPFEDAVFELVVSVEVVEHLERQEAYLDEARRVLVPGGTLVLTTPNGTWMREAGHPENPFHTHEFSHDELGDALRARFGDVVVYGESVADADAEGYQARVDGIRSRLPGPLKALTTRLRPDGLVVRLARAVLVGGPPPLRVEDVIFSEDGAKGAAYFLAVGRR